MTSRPLAPSRLAAVAGSMLAAVALLACSSAAAPASSASTATASPSPTPTATAAASATPTGGATAPGVRGGATGGMLARGVYANALYELQFRFPPAWSRDQGYDQRWSGPDGFVQVLAINSDAGVQQVAEQHAAQHLQPYGSHPTIEPIVIDGVEGRLILPSSDQAAQWHDGAAFIVAPPKPVVVTAGSFRYLDVEADAAHIRAIAASATFISSQPGGVGAQ